MNLGDLEIKHVPMAKVKHRLVVFELTPPLLLLFTLISLNYPQVSFCQSSASNDYGHGYGYGNIFSYLPNAPPLPSFLSPPPPPPPPPPQQSSSSSYSYQPYSRLEQSPMSFGQQQAIQQLLQIPVLQFDDSTSESLLVNYTQRGDDVTSATGGSNLIEGLNYYEQVTSRCMSSTLVDDTHQVEPTFVFVKPQLEVTLNATMSSSLISSSTRFDPRLDTVILIHGYTQSYPSTEWLRKIRALFEVHSQLDSHNLIIMDWSRAAASPFPRAAAMTSVTASFLANFIMKLINLGADRHKIHIIGHSLGAHVAGFAGRRIKPRIGKITALDPAGPCFGKLYSSGDQDKLSPDDAFQVDVHHYDDSFLGLAGQHGHFDVLVNCGSSQPGATDNFNSMVGALITTVFGRKKVLSESHTRSVQVPMTDLESSKCMLVAYECADCATFTRGECGYCDANNSQCLLASFDFQYSRDYSAQNVRKFVSHLRQSSPSKTMFVSTKGSAPYCVFHDQILVRLAALDDSAPAALAASRRHWHVHLELHDEANAKANVTITNMQTHNLYSYLMLSELPRRRIVRVRLHIATSGSPTTYTSISSASTTTTPAPPIAAANLVTLLQPNEALEFNTNYDKLELSSEPELRRQNNNNNSNRPARKNQKPKNSAAINAAAHQARVLNIEINHMSHIDPHIRQSLSSTLCPANEPLELNGKYQTFVECSAVARPTFNSSNKQQPPPPPPPRYLWAHPLQQHQQLFKF